MPALIPKLDELKSSFPKLEIEQQDSANLFIVYLPNRYRLLVSYDTVIGVSVNYSEWYITTERFSITTSTQVNKFRKGRDVLDLTENKFKTTVLKAIGDSK